MKLVLHNVRPWGGDPVDVAIEDGHITAIGAGLSANGETIDGRGGTLLPGLHDHHLHVLALAALRESVDLTGLTDSAAIAAKLRAAPQSDWIRAVGYDERACGLPDAQMLDSWVADRPLRVADRTGALRVLNSRALSHLAAHQLPPGAECAADGSPNGRFWREDRWLGSALPIGALPDLARQGAEFAKLGLVRLTDATAHNGLEEAAILAGAVPQRLILMGSEELGPGDGYDLGPLKLALDERDLPPIERLAERITAAHAIERPVAAHCVTEAELAIYLAALDMSGGSRPGDRIEHGGMIPAGFVPVIADAGLIVVTNPAFIHDRGDRYAATIASEQWEELYPSASLRAAGITLLGSSDAPYGSPDPWLAMRTARERRSAGGTILGRGQTLGSLEALKLYCQGSLFVGCAADLVLCDGSLEDVLNDLSDDRVRATFIAGEVTFARN